MIEKEKALLAGCVRGEKAAWDALVLQYSKLAYSTIRSTLTLHHALPQDDIVEDLHQNFFLSLCENDFRKLRQFRGDRGCSLASWLRVIAARLTIDFLRKQDSSSVEASDEYEDIHYPNETSAVELKEQSLLRAIKALSTRDQLFVTLCFRRALPPQDIAAILKLSVNAVYTQKSRILGKLRELLEEYGSL
jgi:RNA polymerase sigma factor (sigma-70 family)